MFHLILFCRNLARKTYHLCIQNPASTAIRLWYQGLQPREKLLVRIAAIVAALYLCYLVVLMPVLALLRSADNRFVHARADLLWLQQQSAVVAAYKKQGLSQLSPQAFIRESRAFLQEHTLEVDVQTTRHNQDMLMTLTYSGTRPSSFFMALDNIIQLGAVLDALNLNQTTGFQVAIQANLVY